MCSGDVLGSAALIIQLNLNRRNPEWIRQHAHRNRAVKGIRDITSNLSMKKLIKFQATERSTTPIRHKLNMQ
jgi:hypothetical protein